MLLHSTANILQDIDNTNNIVPIMWCYCMEWLQFHSVFTFYSQYFTKYWHYKQYCPNNVLLLGNAFNFILFLHSTKIYYAIIIKKIHLINIQILQNTWRVFLNYIQAMTNLNLTWCITPTCSHLSCFKERYFRPIYILKRYY